MALLSWVWTELGVQCAKILSFRKTEDKKRTKKTENKIEQNKNKPNKQKQSLHFLFINQGIFTIFRCPSTLKHDHYRPRGFREHGNWKSVCIMLWFSSEMLWSIFGLLAGSLVFLGMLF